MNAQRRKKLIRHLEEIIEGANDTTRSMEEGADCLDVLWRLQALRDAVNEAKSELMKDHLERWEAALVQGNNPDQCKELIKEFPILFDLAGRKNTALINLTRKIK